MKRFVALIMLTAAIAIILPKNPKAIGIYNTELGYINTPYEYEILPGSPAWDDLDIEDRFAISNPSTEICQNYTTRALLLTVLDCPFISSLYAFDTIDEGIEKCRNAIFSLDEYMSRSDAVFELNRYISTATLEHTSYGTDYDLEYYIANRLYEYLMKQGNACPDVFIDPVTGFTATYVQTPNNSNVMVYIGLAWSDHFTTQAEQEAANTSFITTYSATSVLPIHPSYNCHSYAWYYSSQNGYWMDDPSPYMTDGSYTRKITAAVGRKITYKIGSSLDHSGIVTSISGFNVYVTSKWGACGVLRSKVHNNPYYIIDNATNIDYWKAN